MYIWVFLIVHQPSHEQQRYAPQQTNGYMDQSHPRVDQHGSHEFIEWQHEQQLLHKQMKLRYPPKVDKRGSHAFVEWQQKQQELYKEMNGIPEKVSNDELCIVQNLSRYSWPKSEDKVHGLMPVIQVILKGS